MLDIGWTEMLVIAIVMIVVVGPKDLPKMLRTFGRATAKMRSMAGDFQRQFNEAMREAELEDVKKSVESLKSLNPTAEIRKQLNPFEKAAADVRAGIDGALKPSPKPTEPPPAAAAPAEPLKAGATAMPAAASEPPPAVSSEARPVTGATEANGSGSVQPSPQQPAGVVPASDPPAKPVVRATRKKVEGAGTAKPKPSAGAPTGTAVRKRRSKPADSAS